EGIAIRPRIESSAGRTNPGGVARPWEATGWLDAESARITIGSARRMGGPRRTARIVVPKRSGDKKPATRDPRGLDPSHRRQHPDDDSLAELKGSTPGGIAERSGGNLLPVPWMEPEDVAKTVLFLASDGPRCSPALSSFSTPGCRLDGSPRLALVSHELGSERALGGVLIVCAPSEPEVRDGRRTTARGFVDV